MSRTTQQLIAGLDAQSFARGLWFVKGFLKEEKIIRT